MEIGRLCANWASLSIFIIEYQRITMSKIIFLLTIFCVLALFWIYRGAAQTPARQPQGVVERDFQPDTLCKGDVFSKPLKAKQAQALLDDIHSQSNNIKLMRAKFQQYKKIKVLRIPLRSVGTFLYSQQRGIQWHQQQPFDSLFIITQRGIWQRSGEKQSVRTEMQDQPAVRSFTQIFLTIFSADPKQIERHFHISMGGQKKHWLMGLVPRSQTVGRVLRCLEINGSNTVHGVRIAETNGDVTSLTFSEVQINSPLLTKHELLLFQKGK
jgi:hypothetical protein